MERILFFFLQKRVDNRHQFVYLSGYHFLTCQSFVLFHCVKTENFGHVSLEFSLPIRTFYIIKMAVKCQLRYSLLNISTSALHSIGLFPWLVVGQFSFISCIGKNLETYKILTFFILTSRTISFLLERLLLVPFEAPP